MTDLSRLEEITDLRTVWPHEAIDFTPWLSQEDNISLLADAIGIDITVDETESSVGDFNVDIFASETGTDRKVIIENQLEDTNHDHLGKLITYASGKSILTPEMLDAFPNAWEDERLEDGSRKSWLSKDAQAFLDAREEETAKAHDAYKARIEEGKQLFVKYIGALWD